MLQPSDATAMAESEQYTDSSDEECVVYEWNPPAWPVHVFQYDELPKDHIRLLRYQNRSITSVYLRIDTFAKGEAPPYVALSHRWGHLRDRVRVYLNDHAHVVRRDLFKALRALRPNYSSQYMWIDALCINQVDVRERNHQVAMMDEIFRQARNTVVWLGHTPRPAFRALPVNEMLVMTLSEQDYWSRTWIVQEILVSTSVTVYAKVDWTGTGVAHEREVRI